MFDFDIADELKLKIRKLLQKDRKKVEIINKKIMEIVSCDAETIKHYKMLKRDMKGLQRVHIDKHFVLVFRVDAERNFVRFLDFDHHDRVY
jgi:mRNA interferase RelE/StbE/toxin YoeB